MAHPARPSSGRDERGDAGDGHERDEHGRHGRLVAAPDPVAVWVAAFFMWLVMMVAMMLPSASPMILLYAAFARGVKASRSAPLAPTFVFAGVYLLLWAAFSAVAATARLALVEPMLISADMLKLGDMRLGGGLLAPAGFTSRRPRSAPVSSAAVRRYPS